MRAMATWCVRHRRLVVLFWLVVLIGTIAISNAAGSSYTNSFTLPGSESTRAIALLESASPKISGDTDQIVFGTSNGAKVTDPDVQASIEAMLAKVAKLPHVTSIVSPYDAAGAHQINKSNDVAFATVTFDEQAQNISIPAAKKFVATAEAGKTDNVQVAVSGQVAEQADKVSLGGVGIGILAAAVVLLLVFGSLFATALPLVSAIAALGTAVSLVALLSHVMKMPMFATELVLLIGLGVGVDYALFIVTRHRQGLMQGRDSEESIVMAVNTSGRAVLFAGIIVCIALLGMFALGVTFLYGLAVSAALGVALTMVAALTLLPAMLGFIGHRVLSRSQRKRLKNDGPVALGIRQDGFWSRYSRFIQRRPIVPAALAILIIVIFALPFFSIRLGNSDEGNDAIGSSTRTAYDMLATGFGPGFNGPLQLVAVTDNALERTTFQNLVAQVKTEEGVASTSPAVFIPSKDGTEVAVANVYPTGAPQDASTADLIGHLRTDVIPKAEGNTGLKVLVGGTTAIFIDFAHVLSSKLPLFIGLVVILSFLLLAVVFRSLLIPAISAVMNLFSIAAAFGILVAVFQWGWLGTVFSVNRPGPIEAFLPVMLFAILFGLSMDYQVFLVTRIHEEWLKSGDNKIAVRDGLAATGKTITAAALIMIVVFGSFILGGERVIKEFGLGLAGGILIDALVIRMAIVPALLGLFGKANWWFPKSLDRILPHIGLEQSDELAVSGGNPDEGPDDRDLVSSGTLR